MRKKDLLLINFEMIIAAAIWGSNFTVIKKILVNVHAITLVCYRFSLATLVFGLILIFLRKNPWQNLQDGIVLGFLLFMICSMQALGLYQVSAANCGFIAGLFIVFLPILTFIFDRKRLGLNILLSLFLVCLGLWSITGGIANVNWGEFLSLVSAISLAFYILYVSKAVKRCDIWVLNFQQCLFIAITALFSILFFKIPFSVTSTHAVLGILYLSIFASMLAFLIQFRVQKIILPFTSGMILSLEPIFAAVIAWGFGGEKFTTRGLIGGLLIITAIIFLQISNNKSSVVVETSGS